MTRKDTIISEGGFIQNKRWNALLTFALIAGNEHYEKKTSIPVTLPAPKEHNFYCDIPSRHSEIYHPWKVILIFFLASDSSVIKVVC